MSTIRRLLGSTLPGKKSNVLRRMTAAERIGTLVRQRWSVEPWGWRLKHITWLLDHHTQDWTPRARYDLWRGLRACLCAVGQGHLIPALERRRNNGYVRPTGISGPLSPRGRPPKLPRRRRKP